MSQIVLYGRDSRKDNAQEREGGSTPHGSSVDKASTSARGPSRRTRRRTRLGAGSPRTLSGRERCGIDRGGRGRWGGRTLLAGEVGALQKCIRTPSSPKVCSYTYRDDGSESTRLIEWIMCLSSRPREGTY